VITLEERAIHLVRYFFEYIKWLPVNLVEDQSRRVDCSYLF
jgi:hypothetical protein